MTALTGQSNCLLHLVKIQTYERHCEIRDEIERNVMKLVLELRRQPVAGSLRTPKTRLKPGGCQDRLPHRAGCPGLLDERVAG